MQVSLVEALTTKLCYEISNIFSKGRFMFFLLSCKTSIKLKVLKFQILMQHFYNAMIVVVFIVAVMLQ